jgi:hypothetical protein
MHNFLSIMKDFLALSCALAFAQIGFAAMPAQERADQFLKLANAG